MIDRVLTSIYFPDFSAPNNYFLVCVCRIDNMHYHSQIAENKTDDNNIAIKSSLKNQIFDLSYSFYIIYE